jgi:hypothetical protein
MLCCDWRWLLSLMAAVVADIADVGYALPLIGAACDVGCCS